MRDVPALLECRRQLVDVIGGTHDTKQGAIIESARVSYAKETGGDVVAAMHEDAMELVALLGAIRSSENVDRAHIAHEHQEKAGAAE